MFLSLEHGQVIEQFCKEIAAGHRVPVNPAALAAGLAVLPEIKAALSGEGAGNSPESQWQARYERLPGMGCATLTVESRGAGAQSLCFYMDARGHMYTAAWAPLQDGPGEAFVHFKVREDPSTYTLLIAGGGHERQVPLGESLPGLAWTSSPDFVERSEVPSGLLKSLGIEGLDAIEIKPPRANEFSGECSGCGAENPRDSEICVACGHKLRQSSAPAPLAAQLACPDCGSALKPGKIFCVMCGARVERQRPPSPPSSVRVCQSCGGEVKEGWEFCADCGEPFAPPQRAAEKTCLNPQCGQPLPAKKRFCPACGTRAAG